MKKIIYTILLITSLLTLTPLSAFSGHVDTIVCEKNESEYLQGLASLMFYTVEWEKRLENSQKTGSHHKKPNITDEEWDHLWQKTFSNLEQISARENQTNRCALFADAYALYNLAKDDSVSSSSCAYQTVKTLRHSLDTLWKEACHLEHASLSLRSQTIRAQANNNLDGNPYIPPKIKKVMRPYIIPAKHPMKGNLDAIFLQKRVTANEQTFADAGFKTISVGKRSFVHVAKHHALPQHLIKAYLDNDSRLKYGKESWEWLVKRCEGAEQVRNVIHSKKIKHFVVTDKWIYPLPAEPSPPPFHEGYVRHYAVLIAKDMKLTSERANYRAWRNKITREHLDELYIIISRARGSSYRPDNIAYTKQGTFAFIDTEYPSKGPDYKSIRLFLNREMRKYWDKIVKNGGL